MSDTTLKGEGVTGGFESTGEYMRNPRLNENIHMNIYITIDLTQRDNKKWEIYTTTKQGGNGIYINLLLVKAKL